ncbi:hypothetical protein [Pseudooceanicola sp. 200-1SW]|uniref:hypothetical protein n=1 Tax=Pseudooceanicola sp. 200-1SW TaxID=3425949 RepID=UPI003D7FD272
MLCSKTPLGLAFLACAAPACFAEGTEAEDTPVQAFLAGYACAEKKTYTNPCPYKDGDAPSTDDVMEYIEWYTSGGSSSVQYVEKAGEKYFGRGQSYLLGGVKSEGIDCSKYSLGCEVGTGQDWTVTTQNNERPDLEFSVDVEQQRPSDQIAISEGGIEMYMTLQSDLFDLGAPVSGLLGYRGIARQ